MDADYEIFTSVIEAGSLSAAGRKLRLSPAMVSKRLARLEARLGARLIHRTTRRLTATDVGQTFYEEIAAVLNTARDAEARVAGRAAAPAGPLRVSAPTSFGRLHVAPHLKDFLDRYPQVELELYLEDDFVDLLGDRIDLAIRISPPPPPGLATHLLTPNRRLLCAAPAYLERHGTPGDLPSLMRHRLLATTGQLPWRLEGPRGAETIAGESMVRTNSNEVVREMVLAGLGISLRSLWDVSDELRAGKLRRIMPAYEGASDVGVYAIHPRGALVPTGVAAFLDHLKGLYAPVPPWDRGAGGPGRTRTRNLAVMSGQL